MVKEKSGKKRRADVDIESQQTGESSVSLGGPDTSAFGHASDDGGLGESAPPEYRSNARTKSQGTKKRHLAVPSGASRK